MPPLEIFGRTDLSARPHGSADPVRREAQSCLAENKDWMPAFAGMSGESPAMAPFVTTEATLPTNHTSRRWLTLAPE